jgi:hypothetical protein
MYDAIVIGARCAGSPMSTHIIHPGGLAALRRLGLLDDLVTTGCAAWPTLRADFGPTRTTREVSR